MFVVVLWTLIGLAAGGMLGGAVADLVASHPGDIGGLFGGLVIGGCLGAAVGGWAGFALNRKFGTDPDNRRRLVLGTLSAPVVVVSGGVLFEMIRASDYLLPSHGAAWVRYEVRLPPETPAPDEKAVVAEFRTEKEMRKQSFPGHDLHVERVGDRVVIKGSFESYRTAQRRTLLLRVGDGPTYRFNLQLPVRPPSGYAKDWSGNWHGAEQIEEAGKPPRPPQPSENLEIRYKMDLV
jgi:MFS family permease